MHTKHLTALLTLILALGLSWAAAAEPATAQKPAKPNADAAPQPETTNSTKAEKKESATATAEADAAEEETDEMNITAERMEMQMEQHRIELSGNVLIEDSTMKLTAQKMTIFLDNDNKMKHIEAEGGVTVRKLDSSESAVGDRGSYDAQADVIVLTGNCTILQGKNAMKGDKVVYDRKNQNISLHGATVTIPLKRGDGKSDKGGMGSLFRGGKTEDEKSAGPESAETKAAPEQKPAEAQKGDGK
ncbi:MAG TPA: lipopolysaccharide transport periplasmic protein LptA [Lentisphaeria bacterium]|nr:lipopolysaccharide transport periplasmic protein LptA [Lentisphaeria bacterium]